MGILLVYDVTDERSFNSTYIYFHSFIIFLISLPGLDIHHSTYRPRPHAVFDFLVHGAMNIR